MGGHRNTSCISYQGIWKPDGPEIGPEILPPVKELVHLPNPDRPFITLHRSWSATGRRCNEDGPSTLPPLEIRSLLLALPQEILHNILLHTNVNDLGALSSSCSLLRDFIQQDSMLWKHMYLSLFVNLIRLAAYHHRLRLSFRTVHEKQKLAPSLTGDSTRRSSKTPDVSCLRMMNG